MDKEHTAMERLRLASDMSLRLYKQPLMLTDSGGKDSAVICRLAENAGIPFEIVHSHTTADAPETVYHVRKRAKEYERKGIEYTIAHPTYKGERTSMWALIPQKLMPPTRVVRYCCQVLKEQYGAGRFIVTGVRWAESAARKAKCDSLVILRRNRGETLLLNCDNDDARRLFESCELKGKRICNPIVDWTEDDVWEYLGEQKVEVNPLYCEGRKRVGCVGCPMAGKAERYAEFAIHPKFMLLYIAAFERMLAERKRRGKLEGSWRMGATGRDVFHWWMEDGVLPSQYTLDDMETSDEYIDRTEKTPPQPTSQFYTHRHLAVTPSAIENYPLAYRAILSPSELRPAFRTHDPSVLYQCFRRGLIIFSRRLFQRPYPLFSPTPPHFGKLL